MRRKVVRIGNAVGVTLPSDLLARYGMHVGDEVDITGAAGHIALAPLRTLGDLFASWEPVAVELSAEDITQALDHERAEH